MPARRHIVPAYKRRRVGSEAERAIRRIDALREAADEALLTPWTSAISEQMFAMSIHSLQAPDATPVADDLLRSAGYSDEQIRTMGERAQLQPPENAMPNEPKTARSGALDAEALRAAIRAAEQCCAAKGGSITAKEAAEAVVDAYMAAAAKLAGP